MGQEGNTDPGYFEPKPEERSWFRNKQTSDRGYMVKRDGKPAVRYDRPSIDQYTHNLDEWEPLRDELPKLSPAHVAQVCFEADKKLCWALGHIDLAQRDWLDLHEKVRARWITEGPLKNSPAFKERKKLYDGIKGILA